MPVRTVLANPPADYVAGRFRPLEGDGLVSTDPADPVRVLWRGAPDLQHVDEAVAAAGEALPAWSATPAEARADLLRRYQQVVRDRLQEVAGLITDEMGKTLAESMTEVESVATKVDITLGDVAMGRVRGYETAATPTRSAVCRFRPHGVMAVIGPFNFPLHLPNGHWVPALLGGNTIVFKPSEKTPAVGQMAAELIAEAGFPPGVFNVVQGAAETAQRLVCSDAIDGILFTGSWPVGRSILQANLDRPGRIVALEMGGNNPAVILDDCDLPQAVVECARAAFATTGQRCTCTRRIIVQSGVADRFMRAFCQVASSLLVGPGRSAEPVFMGPLVTEAARNGVLQFQSQLAEAGGRVIVEAAPLERPGHFLGPGVVEVDRFTRQEDREIFGPLVQVANAGDLADAIEQANATQYGLAAAIFTRSERAWRHFLGEVRSGCINWNTGTAGASSQLPFGGVKHSGNHRPAGAFAADYCAYPVASLEERSTDVAVPTGMRFEESWV